MCIVLYDVILRHRLIWSLFIVSIKKDKRRYESQKVALGPVENFVKVIHLDGAVKELLQQPKFLLCEERTKYCVKFGLIFFVLYLFYRRSVRVDNFFYNTYHQKGQRTSTAQPIDPFSLPWGPELRQIYPFKQDPIIEKS